MKRTLVAVALMLATACGGVEEETSSDPSRYRAHPPDWCVEECRAMGAEDGARCCNREPTYEDCACVCDPRDCGEEG